MAVKIGCVSGDQPPKLGAREVFIGGSGGYISNIAVVSREDFIWGVGGGEACEKFGVKQL